MGGASSRSDQKQGCLVNMMRQDPSVEDMGYRVVWMPYGLNEGPATPDLRIGGLKEPILPDKDGNFLFPADSEARDAVNTIAITDLVITMYRRALKRAGSKEELEWRWGSEPLTIYPLAGNGPLAAYSRDKKALAFCYFNNRWNNQRVYTSRSFDIVAHEAGHAVLDILHQGYHQKPPKDPQMSALNEAFADITAILAFLSQVDNIDRVLAASKGNLHAPNFLCAFGEQCGLATSTSRSLRDLDKHYAIDQVTEDSYDLSCVFTGAVYDILVAIFEGNVDLSREDPAETLYKAAMKLTENVILAFAEVKEDTVTFYTIAQKMIERAENDGLKAIMKKEFGTRKILDPSAKPLSKSEPETRAEDEPEEETKPKENTTCGTGSPEAEDIIRKAAE